MDTCRKIVEYLRGVGVADASSTTKLALAQRQDDEVWNLILWVEKTFDVEIPIDDITAENFATPEILAAYLDRLVVK